MLSVRLKCKITNIRPIWNLSIYCIYEVFFGRLNLDPIQKQGQVKIVKDVYRYLSNGCKS
jgi:hypothetical protein